MTPDNMEQKAREWWDKYAEDADTHNTHPAEHCAAFARSLAPLPLSMTEEEIERLADEYGDSKNRRGTSVWLIQSQAYSDALRYASTHTKIITVDKCVHCGRLRSTPDDPNP